MARRGYLIINPNFLNSLFWINKQMRQHRLIHVWHETRNHYLDLTSLVTASQLILCTLAWVKQIVQRYCNFLGWKSPTCEILIKDADSNELIVRKCTLNIHLFLVQQSKTFASIFTIQSKDRPSLNVTWVFIIRNFTIRWLITIWLWVFTKSSLSR